LAEQGHERVNDGVGEELVRQNGPAEHQSESKGIEQHIADIGYVRFVPDDMAREQGAEDRAEPDAPPPTVAPPHQKQEGDGQGAKQGAEGKNRIPAEEQLA
jgi:hypothetical protein